MTIAGHDISGDADWILRGAEIMASGMPDPFWDDVRRHVVSWLIVAGIGSIGWMAVTMPTRLDRVLNNQETFSMNVKEMQLEIKVLAQSLATVQERVRRIEEGQ
jgi:hypothetical protein